MSLVNFDGLFYLLFGLLLLWAESSVLNSKLPEPYIGWRISQWVWLIFGGTLVFLGIYILSNN